MAKYCFECKRELSTTDRKAYDGLCPYCWEETRNKIEAADEARAEFMALPDEDKWNVVYDAVFANEE